MNSLFKYLLFSLIFLSQLFLVFSQANLNLYSPDYFNDQNNVYEDINYLENEYLSFDVCFPEESDDISARIICGNESQELDLFTRENGNNVCSFSNNEITDFSCDDFKLEISYHENNLIKKVERNFEKQRESFLINYILNVDIQELSPLDLSYYLLTLKKANFNGHLEIDAYERLKNLRDNEEKCWPRDDCEVELTSEILKNLQMADYSLDSRLLADGKIYLEQNILKNHRIDFDTNQESINKEFYVQIFNQFDSNEEIECDLNLDFGDENRSYIFDENSDFEDLFINRIASDEIEFSCDENLDEINLYTFDNEINNRDFINFDNYDYEILNNDLNENSDFELMMFFEHDFSAGEEIICDLEVDGNYEELTFDENSGNSDLLINRNIQSNYTIDCDNDIDNSFQVIFAGNINKEQFENVDSFSNSLSNTRTDSFKFNIFFDYNFVGNEEIDCELNIDDDITRTYTFDDSDELEVIDNFLSSNMNFICENEVNEITLEVFDKFDRKQVNDISYNVDRISYSLPSTFSRYSCLGTDSNCNFYSTLNAVTVYKGAIEEASNLEAYIDSFVINSGNNMEKVNFENENIDSGRYIFHKRNNKISDFLKFRQNNDGSWGSGNLNSLVEESSYVLIGILKSESNSEYIDDGRKWIYFNEPTNGWGTHRRNTLAFLAIREQLKPYLNLNIPNVLNSNYSFVLSNPTIYELKDLELSFTPEIEENLMYVKNLGGLSAEEKINFSVSVDPSFKGSEFGELILTGVNSDNRKIEILKYPLVIEGKVPFIIENKEYGFTEDLGIVSLNLENQTQFSNISCTYLNPFSSLSEEVSLSSEENRLNIENNELNEGNFSINMNCNLNDDDFEITQQFSTTMAKKSFNMDLENNNTLYITSLEDFSVNILSNYDDMQVISSEITGPIKEYINILEEEKIVAASDNRSLFFGINNPVLFEALGNTTTGKLTIYSDTGYFKTVDLVVELGKEEEDGSIPLMWLIIGGIAILLILLVGIRFIQLRRMEEEEAQNFEHNDDEFILDDDLDFK